MSSKPTASAAKSKSGSNSDNTTTNHVQTYVRFCPIQPDVSSPWVVEKGTNNNNNDGAIATAASESRVYYTPTTTTASPTTLPSSSSSGIKGTSSHHHTYNNVFVGADSNAQVFSSAVKGIVDGALEGKNGCVMCYGQTGSGKTHTIFGYDDDDKGIVPRSLRYLFDELSACARGTRFRVAVSYYEIYKEMVNDLLEPPSSAAAAAAAAQTLNIREAPNGVPYVENLSVRMIHDASAGIACVAHGSANKTVGDSYMHDKSSRAHTIFSIQLATERKVRKVYSTQISKINFVDLAGSEMLSYNFGAEQQKETKSINLSLLALRNVIAARANKEKFIPFRQSVLTRLLATSISENAVSAVICTCNPHPDHVTMTAGTLKFGDVTRMVEQHARLNEILREGSKIKFKDKIAEESVKLDEVSGKKKKKSKKDGEEEEDEEEELPRAVVSSVSVNTRQQNVHCYVATPPTTDAPTSSNNICIALHAFGDCDGSDFAFLFDGLINMGYAAVYAPDFPGFGKTPGTRQSSRTQKLNDAGEALEIVYDILDEVTNRNRKKKVTIIGWDWGGNIALSLGIGAYKSRISCMALYHPSWTDNRFEVLHAITVPVLFCWVPSDQLHLLSRGKQMARVIKRSNLVTLVGKAGKEINHTQLFQELARQITNWLKGLGVVTMPKQIAEGTTADAAKTTEHGQRKQQQSKMHNEAAAAAAAAAAKEESTSSESEEDEDEDDFELDSLSTQSSFLACLLSDPLTAATVIEQGFQRQVPRRAERLDKRSAASDAISKMAMTTKAGAATAAAATTEHQEEQETTTPSVEQTAARNIICIYGDEEQRVVMEDALLRRNGQGYLRPQVLSLVGAAPCFFDPSSSSVRSSAEASISILVKNGVWTDGGPQGIRELQQFPRFAFGRRVFVKAPVCANFTNSAAFGCLVDPAAAAAAAASSPALQRAKQQFRTFRGFIDAASTRDRCVVSIPVVASAAPPAGTATQTQHRQASLSLPWTEVADEMNCPTRFPPGPSNGSLYFEDAIVARYTGDILMRLKLLQCAIAVKEIVARMDFAAAIQERERNAAAAASPSSSHSVVSSRWDVNKRLLDQQKKCVERIRSKMNMIHHVAMGKDPKRMCVPDCGRLATHGQWHCHGMASVFASLLIPFAEMLGFEVRYRDGFTYSQRDSSNSEWDGVPHNVADHTWLEITFFPSCVTCVADPSFDHAEGVLNSVDDVYCLKGWRFPMRDLTSRIAEIPTAYLRRNVSAEMNHRYGTLLAEEFSR